MLMRLPNEPVWASAPNFLTAAVSPGTLLCTFLCFCSPPFFWFCLCVLMCVYVCIFPRGLSNLHVHTAPPPFYLLHLLLCLCKWSSHLGLMKAGSKSECRAAEDHFYAAWLSRQGRRGRRGHLCGSKETARQIEAKISLILQSAKI